MPLLIGACSFSTPFPLKAPSLHLSDRFWCRIAMLGSTGQILSQKARSRVVRRGIMHWGAWVYASKNLNILNHSGAKANNGMTWIGPLRNYSSAITELVFKKWLISIKQAILFLNLNKSIAFAPRWFPFLTLELIYKVINHIISTGTMMINDLPNKDNLEAYLLNGISVIWAILHITYCT